MNHKNLVISSNPAILRETDQLPVPDKFMQTLLFNGPVRIKAPVNKYGLFSGIFISIKSSSRAGWR